MEHNVQHVGFQSPRQPLAAPKPSVLAVRGTGTHLESPFPIPFLGHLSALEQPEALTKTPILPFWPRASIRYSDAFLSRSQEYPAEVVRRGFDFSPGTSFEQSLQCTVESLKRAGAF